jgi:hypothetical protein
VEKDEARGKAIAQMACRLLVPGGVFLMVSYEPPAGRMHFLAQEGLDWDVEVPGAEDDKGNFVYVCRKRSPGDALSDALGAVVTLDE